VLTEDVWIGAYPVTRYAGDAIPQRTWLGNGVDKVVTSSLYTGIKQEHDGSNKGRVNITQKLGVENMQFSTAFLFMSLSWCFALGRTSPTVHRPGDDPCYATAAHEQDFVVNYELLLPILKAFAYYTLLKMLQVFSLCVVVEQSVAPTNSSPAVSCTAPDTPTPRGDHLAFCGLYINLIFQNEGVVYNCPARVVFMTV
jgi:hypothetical protein